MYYEVSWKWRMLAGFVAALPFAIHMYHAVSEARSEADLNISIVCGQKMQDSTAGEAFAMLALAGHPREAQVFQDWQQPIGDIAQVREIIHQGMGDRGVCGDSTWNAVRGRS